MTVVQDKFQKVADKILTLMEQDCLPWCKPWHGYPPRNVVSGRAYTGINPVLAIADCWVKGYDLPLFLTFNQAKELGWQVKKGAKATLLYKVTPLKCGEKQDKETGEISDDIRHLPGFINLFNIDLIDDEDAEKKKAYFIEKYRPSPSDLIRDVELEEFIAKQGAKISHYGDRACYSPLMDEIFLPRFEAFSSEEGYYTTVVHELGHWTGHESRLKRKYASFGTQDYAFEELVADLCAAMTCNTLKTDYHLEHHASYIQSWSKLLKDNPRAFTQAAGKASQASKFLLKNAGIVVKEDVVE